MNIRDWPLGQIMQLPDCCFGRRWPISCMLQLGVGETGWDISEVALPDRAVIWEVSYWTVFQGLYVASARLALGDQLPTTVAMMDALEPLLPGFGIQGPSPRNFLGLYSGSLFLMNLKIPVAAQGRRMVFEVVAGAEKTGGMGICLVVSSIPTEVPDCLLSGYLRSQ